MIYRLFTIWSLTLLVLVSCSSTKVLEEGDLSASGASAEQIVNGIPDYTNTLRSISGKGKALVSEPNNSERSTVIFASNADKSLVTVKNSLGIEGGKMLADRDSLLIYNRIDKVARRVSIADGNLSRLDHLATVNILEMINYTFEANAVERVYENDEHYVLYLGDGRKIFVGKKELLVRQVVQQQSSQSPWSRIIYEAYGEIEGFKLPRRVTIFSADRRSKVALLIQSLQINPENLDLEIDIPKNITVIQQ